MYAWPTTQPMSDAAKNVRRPETASTSPRVAAGSKMYLIDAASATAWPPVSRCTPFGIPVVPLV